LKGADIESTQGATPSIIMGKKAVQEVGADNPQYKEKSPWHTMTVEETYEQLGLGTDHTKSGLSTSDAASRLDTYGPNRMTEKVKVTIWQRIWHQINNVLVYVLLTVAAVSIVQAVITTGQNRLTSIIQVFLIVGVITLNTCIGIYQEGNAEKAADALKSMLSSDARVMRDGKEIMIPAEDLVPGDVCLLGLGDKIPSDLRLVSVSNMATGEAALTGEAVPIDKEIGPIALKGLADPEQVPLGDRKNMAYSGK
jgi:magnesium-transporting ATPase (P-type)